MTDDATAREWEPVAGIDPVEDLAQTYLFHVDGNASAALRMAVEDVLLLNKTALAIGAGTSWGFLRRRRDEVFSASE